MEAIPLTSLLPEGFDPKQYKVHFAVWNQEVVPDLVEVEVAVPHLRLAEW